MKSFVNKVPLSTVSSGEKVKLVSIDAGGGLQSRMASMGLTPGVQLEVISNSHRGPFIVAVKNSRVILGRGITQKIFVGRLPQTEKKPD